MRDPNRMPCHITDERVSGDPQDAIDDTRPDHCTCRYSDGFIDGPASDHDPLNSDCDIYECDCGHAKRHHGSQGCEAELGDINVGKEYEEAGGVCQCPLKPKEIR